MYLVRQLLKESTRFTVPYMTNDLLGKFFYVFPYCYSTNSFLAFDDMGAEFSRRDAQYVQHVTL
jgi:hypothetical protein